MKKPPKTVTLNLDEPLDESPRQATSMSLPMAISYKLDVLAERAKAANATRAEIISMLIDQASEIEEDLERGILAHRKKSVRDVLPPSGQPAEDENVFRLSVRTPGRPSRRSA